MEVRGVEICILLLLLLLLLLPAGMRVLSGPKMGFSPRRDRCVNVCRKNVENRFQKFCAIVVQNLPSSHMRRLR